MKGLEKIYGNTARVVFKGANVVKKAIMKTRCAMHIVIHEQALISVFTEGFVEEYNYFKKYTSSIDKGLVWADQDYRSINHFYHYEKKKGLYGFSNAYEEFKKYYKLAQQNIKNKNQEKAMFYLGAAMHLAQDLTIPQHANNRLLEGHKNFELFVIDKYIINDNEEDFKRGIIRYRNIEDYPQENAKFAEEVRRKYEYIKEKYKRYDELSKECVNRAQMTTAGILIDFYKNEVLKYQ